MEICKSKKEGGLGIRNLEAMNKAILLNVAWRIVTSQDSITSRILKSKYSPFTSFWKAPTNTPKSAFWTSILKVREPLTNAVTIQISKGNSSIWSSPWCPFWSNIHDHLNIQQPGFNYPATIKDLWIPNTKSWNIQLLSNLFGADNANIIGKIPIAADNNDDTIIWKFTSSGICTSKSAYQIFCPSFYGHNAGPHQVLSDRTRNIIRALWLNKEMPPRVQVFGWRLMRNAIPTGCTAAARSVHINRRCCRCGTDETDFHLFFSCNFVRAVWFASPLGLRVDGLIQQGIHEIEDALHTMMSTYRADHSTALIFNILWSIWKARNDFLFNKKYYSSLQILCAAKALFNAYEPPQESIVQATPTQSQTSKSPNSNLISYDPSDKSRILNGPNIFTDAAWKNTSVNSNNFAGTTSKAGLGIVITWKDNSTMKMIFIKAISMACSALHAEAQALELAAQIGKAFGLQHLNFLTDSQVLAQAASKRDPAHFPGHWMIRPNLHQYLLLTEGTDSKIFKVKREQNKMAHRKAHDAYNIRDLRACVFSCLGIRHNPDTCHAKAVISSLDVHQCTLLSVTCL